MAIATTNLYADPPGVVYSSQLRQQLNAGLQTLGTGYKPRTEHLDEKGRPKFTNRLILQDSPYLRQHAHNPVDWHPWGPEAFARAQGVPPTEQSFFHTERRWREMEEAKERMGGRPNVLSAAAEATDPTDRSGTVGAVALDREGRIAAATSTGGFANKSWGRVGDSPIIGAGTYAGSQCADGPHGEVDERCRDRTATVPGEVGAGQPLRVTFTPQVVPLVRGLPLAVLESGETAWPGDSAEKLGFRFRGYRFDKQRRPIFRYGSSAIEVEDDPQPVQDSTDTGFRRTLTITAKTSVENLWYRAAANAKIEKLDDGWFLIDEVLKILVISVSVKFAANVIDRSPPNKPMSDNVETMSMPLVSVSMAFRKNCPPPAPLAINAASSAGDNPWPKTLLMTTRSSIVMS